MKSKCRFLKIFGIRNQVAARLSFCSFDFAARRKSMPATKRTLTLLKICGITNQKDALLAANLGAHALGFIFVKSSPRAVSLAQAKAITAALPPFITTVGVFANNSVNEVTETINQIPLQILQFHGDETETECKQFNKPYIKALRIKSELDIAEEIKKFPSAHAILFDSYHPQELGGTGVLFNWQLLPPALPKPIILAGGLTAANVAQAIRIVKPYAVDVSSGVEREPGQKDSAKLAAFIQAVVRADDE